MTDFSPKKVDIVVHSDKIKAFEKELMKNGFVLFSFKELENRYYKTTIHTRVDRLGLIDKICKKCEIDIKQEN